MEIMKFADAREAGLEHLGIGLRRDRRDIVGRQPVEEAIHDFAPAPEIVVGAAAAFGQSRHAALKAMAMDVAPAGQRDTVAFIACVRCYPRLARRSEERRGGKEGGSTCRSRW